ncbi:MAG: ester cyclase [Elstera sp.]|uniref:nuclear transport factor 2 family protein n=1 Tax=Elstera sp. TaxID=1916664 RepID=UPI0037BF6C0B
MPQTLEIKMRRTSFAPIALLIAGLVLTTTVTKSAVAQDSATQKKIVIALMDELFNKHDLTAIDRYIGSYKQHSAGKDGKEGLREFATNYLSKFPKSSAEIKSVVAEGDLVIVLNHVKMSPEDRGQVCFDQFRVTSGKIIEHWDACQDIPEVRQNNNSPF